MRHEERIALLLDKQEIAECITRVARGYDRHDIELALSAFHAGARDDHAVFIGSAPEMVEWANAFHDSGLRGHQHLLTNMSIDVDGDEAHVETYVTVIGGNKADWGHTMGGGRYLDRLERRDGSWGIVDRVTIVEWWSEPETMEQTAPLVHPFSQDRTDPSYTRPLRVTRADRNLSETNNPWADEDAPAPTR